MMIEQEKSFDPLKTLVDPIGVTRETADWT